jgi:hypothetical protein
LFFEQSEKSNFGEGWCGDDYPSPKSASLRSQISTPFRLRQGFGGQCGK